MTDRMEVQTVPAAPVPMEGEASGLIRLALTQGVPVEVLQGLYDLQRRVEEGRARRAFFGALAAFRADCPQPRKTRENSQYKITRSGVTRHAMYAPLEEIDRVARPVASALGLSWTWDTRVEGELMHVTCRLFHADGHQETSTVSMPHESKAGSSPQQKYSSTQSYGMRYSLIAALGITTAEDDVDGNAPEGAGEKITESQAADVEALLEETGANRGRFLTWLGIERIGDMDAGDLGRALEALQKKRGTK